MPHMGAELTASIPETAGPNDLNGPDSLQIKRTMILNGPDGPMGLIEYHGLGPFGLDGPRCFGRMVQILWVLL